MLRSTVRSLLVAAVGAAGFLFSTSLPIHAEARDPKAALQELRAREAKVQALYKKVMPAIVCLSNPGGAGTGSGIIISKDGLILTAGHVTDAIGKDIDIIFPDGSRVPGVSLGKNMNMDSGFAQIKAPVDTKVKTQDWAYVEMGDSNALQLGEWVVAMGHPGGFNLDRKPPVRLGRVWSRDTVGAIFSDCTLIGGDSGGPLFDLEGRLVGIHSSINKNEEYNRHIALDTFRGDWDDLKAGKSWGELRLAADGPGNSRPLLGFTLDRSQDIKGVKVTGIPEDSPSVNSGIKAGDIILKIDGTSLSNFWALNRELADLKAGDTVKLTVKRGEEEVEVEIKTFSRRRDRDRNRNRDQERPREPKAEEKERPEEPKAQEPSGPRPYFGAIIEDAPDGKGAKVTDSRPDSPAAKAGLKKDDVITELNGKPIGDGIALSDQLSKMKPGDKITVKLLRNGKEESVEITLEKK